MDQRRPGAAAGMVGPVLFLTVLMVEGWVRPGYNALERYGSELSLGPRGWIQITNFVVLGLSMMLLARGMAAALPEGRASRVGPLLLGIVGINNIVAGVFVVDPVWPPATWPGIVHTWNGLLAFLLMPISCFAFVRRFREDPAWRWMWGWTLASGVLMTTLIAFIFSPLFGVAGGLAAWPGAAQRAYLFSYLSWLFTLARGLRGHATHRREAIAT